MAALSTAPAVPPARAHFLAQSQGRKPLVVGRLKVQPQRLLPIEPPRHARRALGIRQSILNRQLHVRRTELGHDRAVDKFYQRMHDRLRMNDHVDLLAAARSNSQRASMISRALFIIVAESIVIFWPIFQVGWSRASATVTCCQLLRAQRAERPAAGGEDDPVDFARAGPPCRA